MLEGLERLLPALLHHLSGDINEIDTSFTEQQQQQWQEEGSQRQSQPAAAAELRPVIGEVNHSKMNVNNSRGTSSGGGSDHRWRRCIHLWRGLLGSDRLFLALLFHSGSLWAVEWSSMNTEVLETTTTTEISNINTAWKEGRSSSWAESVLWFLQIHEETKTPVNENNNSNSTSNNNNRGVKSTSGMSREGRGPSSLTSSAIHMYAEDETAVNHTATVLLSEWFTIVDQCGKRFARAYYFSCALKIAALAGNTALIEDIPHLHNLVLKEPRFASQFTSFCSILCSLLVEEAQQQESSRLLMPPPFFLLNFNLIGRGSRIGVWLPRANAANNKNSSSSSSNNKTKRNTHANNNNNNNSIGNGSSTMSMSGMIEDGEFYSCQVTSPGVMLGVPPSSSSITSSSQLSSSQLSSVGTAGGGGGGDLLIGVQLLDEVDMRTIDLLPALYRTKSETHEATHVKEEKKRGRERRHSTLVASSQPRCWSAFTSSTKSYVRVDLLHPRELSMIIPSLSPPPGGPGRRRGPPPPPPPQQQQQQQQQQEIVINTAPLRRNTHSTAPRDPIAAIVYSLATTARRLIGCRGLFVQSETLPNSSQARSDTTQAMRSDKTLIDAPKGNTTHYMRHDTSNIMNHNSTASGGRFTTHTNINSYTHSESSFGVIGAFRTPEEELDCLIECALHLFLASLLMCTALSSELMPHFDVWVVEVISAAVDLALATSQPFVRHLRAVGFVLCLGHQPHQSLLVSVGLLATLARRQRDKGRESSGWWDVFKKYVLEDNVIAGQLPDGLRLLKERAERSLQSTQHARHHKQQQQQQRGVAEAVDTSRTRQVGNAAVEAKTKDDAAAVAVVQRPVLQLRRRVGEREAAKKQKSEIQGVPNWLRPPPKVVVIPTEEGQKQNIPLNDVIMELWWYLEQTTAAAV
ncbi:hypothetical protein LSM04_009263 [Trypanosoma melophagium]|uniref:uncharacterized protein n=1 Tax=Trypanosoma melophagium TaxID=715481 RepID=UPI00351A961E|nr:hypothetical protein LSM04_009263 [Trypanosoma melophagium]